MGRQPVFPLLWYTQASAHLYGQPSHFVGTQADKSSLMVRPWLLGVFCSSRCCLFCSVRSFARPLVCSSVFGYGLLILCAGSIQGETETSQGGEWIPVGLRLVVVVKAYL
jgi:hypothetical protein